MRDVTLFMHNFAELAPHLTAADFCDEYRVRSAVDLRSFLAGMTAPHPVWLRTLFLGSRSALAFPTVAPADVPFSPGSAFGPFIVETAVEERLWMAAHESDSLTARLAVAPEELPCGERLYHLTTMVRFKSARGRLYMGLIRPFHALVCDRLTRLGAWGGENPGTGACRVEGT